ncbi:MAG: hypothetical protein MUD12_10835 [Spirochaetes bacterium]|nr:hypothetical protein [Spirochaetota bacterium]
MKFRRDKYFAKLKNLSFGAVEISDRMKCAYKHLNKSLLSLCKDLPLSVQAEAINFLMSYAKISPGEPFDFFKKYYIPAWSVICHASGGARPGIDGNPEAADAIRGQAMSMFLHSLDDHVNDGDMRATHLILLIRSAAWSALSECISRLSESDDSSKKTAGDLIDLYYEGICSCEETDGLEQYLRLFKKQMATWLIMPLISARRSMGDGRLEDLRAAYESFGMAWRILDDLNDLDSDIIHSERSAAYHILPGDGKKLWSGAAGGKGKNLDRLVDIMYENQTAEILVLRAEKELASAAGLAERIGLGGLASEYDSLRRPLAEFRTG